SPCSASSCMSSGTGSCVAERISALPGESDSSAPKIEAWRTACGIVCTSSSGMPSSCSPQAQPCWAGRCSTASSRERLIWMSAMGVSFDGGGGSSATYYGAVRGEDAEQAVEQAPCRLDRSAPLLLAG